MAILGTKISQLLDGVDLEDTDFVAIARGSDNKSIRGSKIATKAQLDTAVDSLVTAVANVKTNLGNTPSASTVVVSSSTGTSTTLPAATLNFAGVMTAADKAKLESAITSVPAIGKTWADFKC
jgi:hypothetical protein